MKKTIDILLSFFTAVIIFAFGVGLAAAIVTSAPYINGIVFISGYTKNVEAEIAESLQSVAIPSGLPEDFFDDKIKMDFIKSTVEKSIDSALNGKAYEMPSEEIEASILEDVVAYAKNSGVELNEESTEMLKETAKLSGNFYKNYTYNIFYRALKHINGISAKLFIAAAVLAVMVAVMLYLLNGKKELSYALLAGGSMIIITVVFMIVKGAFKLAIASKALLSFVNFYVGILIAIMVVLGLASILFGTKKAKEHIK